MFGNLVKHATNLFHRQDAIKQFEQRTGFDATNSRQPFDLKKMKGEPERRQKRRQLLKYSLPFVIIFFLITLWFLLPMPLTHQGINNYKHQDYKTARKWITPLTWTSPQQFVIAFNSGTIDTQLGKYDLAQGELVRAYTLAAPNQKCMVLQNLVYSLTAHFNSLQASGDFQKSIVYDQEAGNLKTAYPKCFPPPKLPGNTNGGGGGGGGGGAQSSQVLDQAQQQQLQQKNDQGQQSQQQDFQQNNFNQTNPNIKPW